MANSNWMSKEKIVLSIYNGVVTASTRRCCLDHTNQLNLDSLDAAG